MFPKLNSSDPLWCNLRRPYSTRRGNGFQNYAELDTPTKIFGYQDGQLDLSVHHPSSPFGNRFAPLARPEAVAYRDKDFFASRPHRRSRNSRGTKEAKKGRDSRRNKRKLAVQELNEQLSRNIEDTLLQHNIYPILPATPMHTSISQPIYGNRTAHVAPYAPQLPPISFHEFNLPDFLPLAVPRINPPPSLHVGVPAWCPPIPSLISTQDGLGELPKFYDLSCLQEPKCQELQLRRRSSVTIAKKESRFFPPRPTSPKPVVRLPLTGPNCTTPDAELQDPSGLAWKSSITTTRPDSITQAIERIIAAAMTVQSAGHDSQPPSAANLWNILGEQSAQQPIHQIDDHETRWKNEGSDVDNRPAPVFSGQLGPVELAGSDVPYVHVNSLTGYANETAAHHSEGHSLGDSAIYLAEMVSSGSDARALHGLYGMPLTQSPSTSTLKRPTSEIVDPLRSTVACSIDVSTIDHTTGGDLHDSIAQFRSEQDLFVLPLPAERAGPSRTVNTCDLSTFLLMGHAENCWCLACEEEPDCSPEGAVQEPEDTFTEDDGWLVWSTAGCENASTVVAESIATVDEPDSGKESRDSPIYTQSEWGDHFPSKPPHARALYQSEVNVQLGCHDDGTFHSNDEVDEDEWEWNF